ncbi:MAG: tetratricopeptide repeat protein [Proteobacteria bacterium]|nr:tetratricopeptide repeat protein [Pseudomonadota bacterium]
MIRSSPHFGRGGQALLLLLVPLFGGAFDLLRTRNAAVERGNAELAAGRAKEALAAYDEALAAQPDAQGVHYNRGVALHRLGQHDAARQALLRATQGEDRALRAKSFFNLGDVDFEQKRFAESATAFQQALRLDPRHRAAKWNLELALRRREQEEKKQRQDKKGEQQKPEQKKGEQQKNEQKKSEQQKPEQKPDAKKQPQATPKGEKGARPDPQQPPREPAATPSPAPREQPAQAAERAAKTAAEEQAERERQQVLDALDRGDKNVQRERARLQQGLYRPPLKDW